MNYSSPFRLLVYLIYILSFGAIIFLLDYGLSKKSHYEIPISKMPKKTLHKMDINTFQAKLGNSTAVSEHNNSIHQNNDNALRNRCDIKIIVLTMTRHESLHRLLLSIAASDYGSDRICMEIHIDFHKDNSNTVKTAQLFKAKYSSVFTGGISLRIFTQNIGLREAWFKAWYPESHTDCAVIFEDDTEVSPVWYKWLKSAWSVYHKSTHIAGISLQKQQLIPKIPNERRFIINNHQPFLYKLVGSIGFSPHPRQWRAFIDWVSHIDVAHHDMDVPGLITSQWWKALDKKHIWTQCFIFFCEKHNLYTLYVTLPNNTTLTAHWQEKGEHSQTSLGRDFVLAREVNMSFPVEPVKYGWDGIAEKN